jgi:hypothetical protein
VLVDQPLQHLGYAVGTVGGEALGTEPEAIVGALNLCMLCRPFGLPNSSRRLAIDDDRGLPGRTGRSLVWSPSLSAMTGKVVAQEFIFPTAFAIVLAAVLSTGAVYLINNCFGPIDQAEARNTGPIDRRP